MILRLEQHRFEGVGVSERNLRDEEGRAAAHAFEHKSDAFRRLSTHRDPSTTRVLTLSCADDTDVDLLEPALHEKDPWIDAIKTYD